MKSRAEVAEGDYRREMPRFAEGNLAKNRALVEALEIMVRAKNGTAAQVAIMNDGNKNNHSRIGIIEIKRLK